MLLAFRWIQRSRRALGIVALAGIATCGAAQQPASTAQPGTSDRAKAYLHYSLGHLYYERGVMGSNQSLLNQAIDEFEEALKYDPESNYLSMELAELYAGTGRWRSALQQIEDSVDKNPANSAARGLLGRLYVRLLNPTGRTPVPTEIQDRAVARFEKLAAANPADVDTHLILAQLYRATNNSAKAEETLKAVLKLNADSSEANTQLALLYLDVGDYRSAIDLLKRVTEEDDDPELLRSLAGAYEQTRDYQSAAAAYARALQRDPDNPALRRGLAESLLFSRQYDQALEQFQSIAEDDPRDPEPHVRISQIYRQQQKYAEARKSLARASELAPDNLEIRYNQVLLEEAEGNSDEAIRLTREMLNSSRKPAVENYTGQEKNNRAIFLEKLGALYRDRKDYTAAEGAYTQLRDLGGEHSERGQIQLIETYQDAHQYDRALDASSEALKKDPESRELILTHASLLATTGKVDDGVKLIKSLLRNNKQDREVWLAVSQTYLRAKKYSEALDATKEAEKLSDSDDEKSYIYFQFGSIWERQKNFENAEREFRRSLSVNPDSAMTLNYLGYMFADQGIKLDEAISMIEKALEMEPENGAYLDSLGWAHYRKGNYAQAEQLLKRAAEKEGADPTILEHLGDVYSKTNRMSEAVAQWKRALEEWKKLPPGEINEEEFSRLERKLREAEAKK
jgi:tetratricopeptide (TPR) repeat protein